jgi:hypothetical protein
MTRSVEGDESRERDMKTAEHIKTRSFPSLFIIRTSGEDSLRRLCEMLGE